MHEYRGKFPGNTPPTGREIDAAQFRNRMLLRTVMMRHGFQPIAGEWRHFTLADEPYPETCFDHPVR